MERKIGTKPLGLLGGVQLFFGTWRFGVFALSLLFFFCCFVGFLLFFPFSDNSLGAFAAEFKKWCFGYNSQTGDSSWAYVFMFFFGPFFVASSILVIWGSSLKQIWLTYPKAIRPFAFSGFLVVVLLGVSIVGLYREPQTAEANYSWKDLRTTYQAPDFTLSNQDGKAVSLDDFGGKVVLLTAFYSSCPHTCPLILSETKRVVQGIPPGERQDLRTVAITLDPERDSVEQLQQFSQAYGVSSPEYHFLTGNPEKVNQVLDQLAIARKRDTKTGLIDHANLFILIDRLGRIAYHFTLGEDQESWLKKALHALLEEDVQS